MSKSGEVSFYSNAPLENIEAHNLSPNSIFNSETRDIAFLIPINNFKFAKELMREHFNEKYLQSDKYPTATFKGKINNDIDFLKQGNYPVMVTGLLSIHGIEMNVTESGMITVNEKSISMKSEFLVALASYHIPIPQLLFQNIADTVRVKIEVTYEPYNKK